MRLVYGDNQFLGVNHSASRGAEYLNRYDCASKVAATLREAWVAGMREFAFTVTPQTVEALKLLGGDFPFLLYPAIPYAHSVNSEISEKGLAGSALRRIKSVGATAMIGAVVGLTTGRYESIFQAIIKSELDGIDMQRVRSVGLLNVATDLLLGLHRVDILEAFSGAVTQLNLTPQFYTMNFPMLAHELWEQRGINCDLIFNVNTSGFRMNPSRDAVIEAVKKYRGHKMTAMSVFSGSTAEDAHELLASLPEIDSVLFGSSNPANIRNNVAALGDLRLSHK